MASEVDVNARKLKLIQASSMIIPLAYFILTILYLNSRKNSSLSFVLKNKVFQYSFLSAAVFVITTFGFLTIAEDLGITYVFGNFHSMWLVFWLYFIAYSVLINRFIDRDYFV